ncbi:MAG: 1-acyl-sn-glycerol-3-phosphate acyltransferase [Deltaproteobacteria bacterium]|nr:1-acyl-sn-glycerol-3-phosphate acyltransferase [Deltaproteobacteria bacterium]
MTGRLIGIGMLVFIGISSMFLFMCAFVLWLLTVPFDKRLVILHYFSSLWASLYLWIMPAWSVSIEGREHIKKKTYVVVSNHQSLLDILVVFRIFFPFKWVSKVEIFRIPFIGWNMTLNRYIKLVRGDKESIRQMLQECNKTLAKGSSVFMFPEGTRSDTGELRLFKPGAFMLAKENNVPILPIVINGTRDALPKKSLKFHGNHKIRVKILEELPCESFASLTDEETAAMVRSMIAEQLIGM